MSPAHSAYVRRETLVAVALNSVLTLGFALLATHGRPRIPLWGANGMALDLVPQLFMMTFAPTLAVTLLTRERMRKGEVAPLPGAAPPMPRTAILRAILFGLAVVIVCAPLGVAGLAIAGVRTAPLLPYLVAKVALAVMASLVIGPLVTLAALTQPSFSRSAPSGKLA